MGELHEARQDMPGPAVGFAPEEVDLDRSTRDARLKWVVVVDEALPAGRASNAAVCVAAPTAARVPGLLGVDVTDAEGNVHPALPWVGCTVLTADAAALRAIRAKAGASPRCSSPTCRPPPSARWSTPTTGTPWAGRRPRRWSTAR